jgi:hypothetical protein
MWSARRSRAFGFDILSTFGENGPFCLERKMEIKQLADKHKTRSASPQRDCELKGMEMMNRSDKMVSLAFRLFRLDLEGSIWETGAHCRITYCFLPASGDWIVR